MGVSENERAEFHDRDETGQIHDFRIWITTIENAGEVEEFCALVYFCPETVFEGFFGGFECGGFFDEVQVGEDTDDFWESVGLEDVEEFKNFLYYYFLLKSKQRDVFFF